MKAHYFSFCNSATENRTHLCYHFGNSETWLGKYWYIQPPFHRIPPSWQDWFLRYVVYEALAVWIRVSKTVTGTLPFKVEMLLILCPLVYKNNTIWTCLAVYVIRSPTWCKPKKKKIQCVNLTLNSTVWCLIFKGSKNSTFDMQIAPPRLIATRFPCN